MTHEEAYWLETCKSDHRYCIRVDNDAVFVDDTENAECVFDFNTYGWEFALELLRHIGCNADPV